MRPILSNIGITTYEITKYLNKLLIPLSQSEYFLNTKDLTRSHREEIISARYKMVSFDVESLFTNSVY